MSRNSFSARNLKAGRLVPILPSYTAPLGPIYAVYPSRRYLSAKVRAFVDFLSQRYANANWA